MQTPSVVLNTGLDPRPRTAWSIYTYKTEFDPARLTSPVLRTH
jgi:hypothetical protein